MTDHIKHGEQQHVASPEEAWASKRVDDVVIAPDAGGLAAGVGIARVRGRSPSEILWLKLRRNRTAMVGLYTLAAMYAAAILAGFIAPYKYDDARHDLPFYPPMLTRIHIFDEQGRMSRPFVYGIVPVDPQLASYRDDTSKSYPIRFFVRGGSYRILWLVSSNIHLFGVDEPGHLFLFGADQVGQDIFSRILYGSQVSLSIGIVGILISTIIGMIVGGIAGYFGGITDFALMRGVEVLLALPSLYFILILRQLFGTGMSSTHIYFIIVVILAFIGWATEARVIRGMVMSLKEQEYVVAARAMGFTR